MSSYDCPHCKCTARYTGDGLADEETEIVTCRQCEREFFITAHVSVSYWSYCLDGDHDFGEFTELPEAMRASVARSYRTCKKCLNIEATR